MRLVLAAAGIAGVAAAGMLLLFTLPPGFPDGYISPYDQATGVWVTILTYALLLAGIFVLAAAAFNKPRPALGGAVVALLLYSGLGLVEACPRLEWCAATVLQVTGIMIDDGTGG